MFHDVIAVLSIDETAPRFSAAEFFDAYGMNYAQPVNIILLNFVTTWLLVYTGYPNRREISLRAASTLNRRKQLANKNGIQLRCFGIEFPSSLITGESFYYPPHRI